jgi:hypothetical protein
MPMRQRCAIRPEPKATRLLGTLDRPSGGPFELVSGAAGGVDGHQHLAWQVHSGRAEA